MRNTYFIDYTRTYFFPKRIDTNLITYLKNRKSTAPKLQYNIIVKFKEPLFFFLFNLKRIPLNWSVNIIVEAWIKI